MSYTADNSVWAKIQGTCAKQIEGIVDKNLKVQEDRRRISESLQGMRKILARLNAPSEDMDQLLGLINVLEDVADDYAPDVIDSILEATIGEENVLKVAIILANGLHQAERNRKVEEIER